MASAKVRFCARGYRFFGWGGVGRSELCCVRWDVECSQASQGRRTGRQEWVDHINPLAERLYVCTYILLGELHLAEGPPREAVQEVDLIGGHHLFVYDDDDKPARK